MKPTRLEAVAADHLGIGVTSGQVEYSLNKLYNDRTNKGLLVHYGLQEAQRAGVGVSLPVRRAV